MELFSSCSPSFFLFFSSSFFLSSYLASILYFSLLLFRFIFHAWSLTEGFLAILTCFLLSLPPLWFFYFSWFLLARAVASFSFSFSFFNPSSLFLSRDATSLRTCSFCIRCYVYSLDVLAILSRKESIFSLL